MANSSLATYRCITSNNSGARTQRISKITVHYMAGQMTGAQCANYFYNCGLGGRQASSNYCIGYNGDIAVSVDEGCRSWASSSEWNDQRAVTIECSNNPDSSLTNATYNALLNLCADICKRNGIDPHYNGTITGTLTMHCQYASTSCPGNWLKNKIISGQFERDIKARMGQTVAQPNPTPQSSGLESYSGYVKVTYTGAEGLAYHSKPSWADNTIAGTAKAGTVFTIVGRQLVDGVYMYKIKSGYFITSSTKYVQYLKSIATQPARKSNTEIAREVIAGKWGNGDTRRAKLAQAGYDYNAIQKEVNRLLIG